MYRYDRDQGYDRGYPGRGFRSRFGMGPRFAGPEAPWHSRDQFGMRSGGGYDRGIYGDSYPGFRGSPASDRNPYYGGGRGGFQRGYDAGRGYQHGGSYHGGYDRAGYGGYDRGGYGQFGGSGYDTGYAEAPFIPEEAYLRHPEFDRPQRHIRDTWPDGPSAGMPGQLVGDDEIQQAVRQNLYQDNWVDADRIEVEVEDGVVTLKGEVDDFLEARYAWDDAWETSGVRGVVNHIHVRVDGPAGEHDTMVQGSTGKSKKKAG